MYFTVSESIPLFNFSEFAKEKDRVESRAGFLLLKEEQKLEREMNVIWKNKQAQFWYNKCDNILSNYLYK